MNESLEVLVPQGRDAHISYAQGVPLPGVSDHEPINFHAMAAATGGGFHVSDDTIPRDGRTVLVLIPRRSRRALEAIKVLRERGHRVLATWKECGRHQLDHAMIDPDHNPVCRELDELVNAWVSVSPAATETLNSMNLRSRIIEMLTPYPIDEAAWRKWPIPAAERSGIFIGTREWSVPARRHAQAVRIAAVLAQRHPALPITLVNTDGWRGSWRIWRAGHGLNMLAFRRMPYLSLLETMSRHRVVLQRDQSGVPGQVAGDALLAGVPCVGGGGRIDEVAFPHLPGAGASDEEVIAAVDRLLTDANHADAVMQQARDLAMGTVSFAAFRKHWESLVIE